MLSKVIKEKQDLTWLNWSKIRNSSGTAGSFMKAYSELNGKKVYYKLSNYDAYRGIVGHESVNEIIVDRLLSILGIEHLSYQLINADIKINGAVYNSYICASDDFKEKNESKIAFDAYYQIERIDKESPMEFCIRNGWEKYIYEMLVVDFLILNRDRHGANIEILRNSKDKTIRIAPLFDHGLSLLFSCNSEEELEQYDVMEDKKIQCFVGSNSVKYNLDLINREKMPELRKLNKEHKEVIFEDLVEVISPVLKEKIWEMIWRRWKFYEDFCNKR